MSTDDYIALLDHDDLLHPSAPYEVMKAICEKNEDFVYTDETIFHDIPNDSYYPNLRLILLRIRWEAITIYVIYPFFSRALLINIGLGFCSSYNGSQDYDMIFRLTKQAK